MTSSVFGNELNERMPMQDSEITAPVVAFVDTILNGHDGLRIPDIFSPSYRDHDPLSIPSIGLGAGPQAGTVAELQRLVGFLALESVDIQFVIEDLFSHGDRAAYRLFGQGTVKVILDEDRDSVPNDHVDEDTPFHITASRQDIADMEDVTLFGSELHLEYSCTGIFHIRSQRLQERWGHAVFQ